jgi:hypothetical protein
VDPEVAGSIPVIHPSHNRRVRDGRISLCIYPRGPLTQQDLERIARATLKEFGISTAELTILPVEGQPDQWRIEMPGVQGIKIKCGKGSSPQWVREQIFEQYLAQR